LPGVLHRIDILLKGDLLGRMIKGLPCQPTEMRLRPTTADTMDAIVAQEERVEPLLHPSLGVFGIFAATHQVMISVK
jgi:hypothetical protein